MEEASAEKDLFFAARSSLHVDLARAGLKILERVGDPLIVRAPDRRPVLSHVEGQSRDAAATDVVDPDRRAAGLFVANLQGDPGAVM